MGSTEPLKVVLLTHYSVDSGFLIQHLLQRGVILDDVIFTFNKKRLPWRIRIKNLFTHGSYNEPSKMLASKNINYLFVNSHNAANLQERLLNKPVDILLLYGTKIIKEDILKIPQIGTLNAHSSLLPKYRGGKAEFWMLFNDEPQYAGVTIHWVTAGLDEGDIFIQEAITVEKDESPQSLRNKSIPLAAKLFAHALEGVKMGEIVRTPQNKSEASTYRWPTKKQIKLFLDQYGK